VHYRTPELLKLCLERLHEHLAGLEYEINVVDNSFINRGFAKGVNEGLRQTTGTYRLILNPDTLITAGAVQAMIAYMESHEDIGVLGPRLMYFNGDHQQSYRRFYRPLTIAARRTPLGKLTYFKNLVSDFMMLDTDPEQIQTPDWILGAALLVRAQALEDVGPMDERFFLYFEDVDWCRRFWHAGYKVVYYPKAVFYHYYERASSKWGLLDVVVNQKTRWHITSAIKFFYKYRRLNPSSAKAARG
jgi:N-acetylglucosaminyl-diphospho-decaprenol L-rhamnosyltransferase